MTAAASAVTAAAGPLVILGIVALIVLLLGFVVMMVRSAPTKMRVKIWKIEIERGDADPTAAALTESEPPEEGPLALRSLPKPDSGPATKPG